MRENPGVPTTDLPALDATGVEDDLTIALRLSEEQERLRQEQIRTEENMLARVLELSMKEK